MIYFHVTALPLYSYISSSDAVFTGENEIFLPLSENRFDSYLQREVAQTAPIVDVVEISDQARELLNEFSVITNE